MVRRIATSLGVGAPHPSVPRRTVPIEDGGDQPNVVFAIAEDPETIRTIHQALDPAGYRVEAAWEAASAARELASLHPLPILVDPDLLDAEGARFARRLLADQRLMASPILALPGEAGAGRDWDDLYDGVVLRAGDSADLADRLEALRPRRRQSIDSHGFSLPSAVSHSSVNPAREAETFLAAVEAGLPDSQFAACTHQGIERLTFAARSLRGAELAHYLVQAGQLGCASTVRARKRFASLIRLCREALIADTAAAGSMPELRRHYLNRRRDELTALERALETRDFETLRQTGHNLKGTGAAYGFGEFSQLGRALEAAAHAADAAAVDCTLGRVEMYLGIVLPAFFAGHPESPVTGLAPIEAAPPLQRPV